jgi:hypothetical protein
MQLSSELVRFEFHKALKMTDDFVLPYCDVTWTRRRTPTLRRNTLSPPSGLKYLSKNPHCVIVQNKGFVNFFLPSSHRNTEMHCFVLQAGCMLFIRLLLSIVWSGNSEWSIHIQERFENFIFTQEREAVRVREESSTLEHILAYYSRNKLLQPQTWNLWRFLYLSFKN